MKCPQCASWSETKDTRVNVAGNSIRRRRHCANGHRFTTRETVEAPKQKEPDDKVK